MQFRRVPLVSGLTLISAYAYAASVPATLHGPLHVLGNQIVNADGKAFLIRGTQTAPFHLATETYDSRSTPDFGPHSSTSLSAIRLRMGLNAVRIEASVQEASDPKYIPELRKFVQLAGRLDLVVVVSARENGAGLPTRETIDFWRRCADQLKNEPNVVFDAFANPSAPTDLANPHSAAGWQTWWNAMAAAVHAIRQTGAQQPIELMSWSDGKYFTGFDSRVIARQPNLILEVEPTFATTRTNQDRYRQFGFLAATTPVLANDLDPHLENEATCAGLPAASELSRFVSDELVYFDSHQISWTASSFEKGKLLEETVNLIHTKLSNGYTCGNRNPQPAGIGRLILSHQFGTTVSGLVVVTVSGSRELPRGGVSIIYGRIMGQRDSQGSLKDPSAHLAGVRVAITDPKHITRLAPLLWVSAGWGNVNFILPDNSAPGVGKLTILRDDGTQDSARIQIVDSNAAFFTQMNCQGPALGTYAIKDAYNAPAAISHCNGNNCATIPVPVQPGRTTTVQLFANGLRHAAPQDLLVTVGGVRVPVLSYGPADSAGADNITISIPSSLAGAGEVDLNCTVRGRPANTVRIAVAGPKRIAS